MSTPDWEDIDTSWADAPAPHPLALPHPPPGSGRRPGPGLSADTTQPSSAGGLLITWLALSVLDPAQARFVTTHVAAFAQDGVFLGRAPPRQRPKIRALVAQLCQANHGVHRRDLTRSRRHLLIGGLSHAMAAEAPLHHARAARAAGSIGARRASTRRPEPAPAHRLPGKNQGPSVRLWQQLAQHPQVVHALIRGLDMVRAQLVCALATPDTVTAWLHVAGRTHTFELQQAVQATVSLPAHRVLAAYLLAVATAPRPSDRVSVRIEALEPRATPHARLWTCADGSQVWQILA